MSAAMNPKKHPLPFISQSHSVEVTTFHPPGHWIFLQVEPQTHAWSSWCSQTRQSRRRRDRQERGRNEGHANDFTSNRADRTWRVSAMAKRDFMQLKQWLTHTVSACGISFTVSDKFPCPWSSKRMGFHNLSYHRRWLPTCMEALVPFRDTASLDGLLRCSLVRIGFRLPLYRLWNCHLDTVHWSLSTSPA